MYEETPLNGIKNDSESIGEINIRANSKIIDQKLASQEIHSVYSVHENLVVYVVPGCILDLCPHG